MSISQKMVYEAITGFIKENGYSPTIRELCKITGKRSTATIHHHLKVLKEQGYIDYKVKSNRTIRIIK